MQRATADGWANPSSVHQLGQRARAYLDDAREAVAELVGFEARDVVLTSGGSEANNLAVAQAAPGACRLRGSPVGALVTSRLEHPSVLRMVEQLELDGATVRWAAVSEDGTIDVASLRSAVAAGPTALVSVQAVNHETGVVQPLEAVARVTHEHHALLHVDAVQAVGKLVQPLREHADIVTIAAHKIRGPKGIGALLTRPELKLQPLLIGGEQERGLRPGTQSPALAAGLAAAARLALTGPARYAPLGALRDETEAALRALGACGREEVLVNGTAARVPHVSNLSWPSWRAAELCAALDLLGVAIASGSACSAGTAAPSPVVTAMHGPERARGAVRISMGASTTRADMEQLVAALERVLGRNAR